MKKLIFLLVPIFVLAGVIFMVARLEAQRVPDWRTELENYLATQRVANVRTEVRTAVLASQPEAFAADMGSPVRQHWPWEIEQIPYPPTALWCVLLERSSRTASGAESQPQQQLLYVARHSDKLWRVGWLVHEGPQAPFAPALDADLAALGCQVGTR